MTGRTSFEEMNQNTSLPEDAGARSTRVTTNFWLLIVVWTILVIGLLVLDFFQIEQVQREMAKTEARSNFNKDQAFRFWASKHGGVYVPINSRTPLNPFLSHVPERDITTPSGKALTLMNPAYMLRQTLEEYEDLFGIRGHITSLKHYRPETAPDEWERSALLAFERGDKEVLEFSEIEGKPYLRLMQPMMAKKSCLKCHARQGYKVGDVRGGVSVSVPMSLYLTNQRKTFTTHAFGLGLVWLLGIAGIGMATRGLRNRNRARDKAEAALQKAHEELEVRVEERTAELKKEIEERRQAEEALRESEEKYRTLVEDSFDGIFVQKGSKIVFTNTHLTEMLGYDKGELLGMHHWLVYHPDYHELTRRRAEARMRGEAPTSQYEVKLQRKDGSSFDGEINAKAISFQGEPGVQVWIRDITERMLAEERTEGLNRLKGDLLGPGSLTEKMKRITDVVVDILDADFVRIWLTNQGDMCDAGCMHAKVSEGPHVCRERNRCLHLVAGSGRYTHTDGAHGRVPFGCYKIGRVAAADDPGFLTNDVTHDPRVHNHEWARELGLVSFAGYRLVSHEGSPIGVLALFSKRALSPNEEALLQTIAGTASEVVQAGRSVEALQKSEDKFRQLNTELVAKNEELAQVLYATSHDLRSPLVNVQGFNKELDASLQELNALLKSEDVPQTVKERCVPIIDEDIPESLHYILSSTSRMDALLNGLLVLSRLGRQKLTLKKLDMDTIIKDVVANFEHEIQEKNVKIDIWQLPPCRGDELQINRVFSNLVGNALKYLEPDRPGVVTISGRKEGDGIKYVVEDNGIGIPSNQLKKIFDLFYKLDPKTEGIGLGLSIVKQLLDKNGGNMDVDSKPDEGTKFIISLPDS